MLEIATFLIFQGLQWYLFFRYVMNI